MRQFPPKSSSTLKNVAFLFAILFLIILIDSSLSSSAIDYNDAGDFDSAGMFADYSPVLTSTIPTATTTFSFLLSVSGDSWVEDTESVTLSFNSLTYPGTYSRGTGASFSTPSSTSEVRIADDDSGKCYLFCLFGQWLLYFHLIQFLIGWSNKVAVLNPIQFLIRSPVWFSKIDIFPYQYITMSHLLNIEFASS